MSTITNSIDGLFAFLMEKCGGEEAVHRQYYGRQIRQLARKGRTLDEVRAVAEKEGWLRTLGTMQLTTLVDIINAGQPGNAINAASSQRQSRRSRARRQRATKQRMIYEHISKPIHGKATQISPTTYIWKQEDWGRYQER